MNCTKIISASNPKIKQALAIKNKRAKYKGAAFIIEGPHLIEMAISSGHRIKEVFFTSAFSQRKDGQRLLGQLSKKSYVIVPKIPLKLSFRQVVSRNPVPCEKTLDSRRSLSRTAMRDGNNELEIEIFEVTEQILKNLAGTETPQGIIAIASYNSITPDDIAFKSIPLIVIVDSVQEPGNLGAIIRTSDAAGADAVIILEGTCDAFSQKAIRATAGSIFNIPIVYEETDKLLEWLKAKEISLAATSLDAKKSLFDADLKKPLAFVFGNEAHGVSSEIKRNADTLLKIPIPGKAESLNVSASAAVCLYEAVRQRMIKV